MEKLMILGASVLQLPAIRQAKELGLHVIAVDMDEKAIGFSEPGITKEVISTIDIPAVVAAAKKHSINGIITIASDMPMRSVAAVSKEMNVIGISEDTAIKATNKYVMRQAFKENNVACPEFYKVSTKEEFLDIIKKFEKPFIVKPADNSGSRGVFLVKDAADLNNALEAYEYSKKYSRNGDVMVEEYMIGPEVSVELFSINGTCSVLQVTDKLTTGAPHFVEIGHSQPSSLPADALEKIKQLAINASKAVGIIDGPGHAEIILTSEGPKMVEIGARMGGGCITTHLVPFSTGINMTKATIENAIGKNPDITQKFKKGSAIRFIIPTPGIVTCIDTEEASKIKGVKEIVVQCKVGQKIGELENGSSRIGYVISQADTVEEAIKICESALSKIRISVK